VPAGLQHVHRAAGAGAQQQWQRSTALNTKGHDDS